MDTITLRTGAEVPDVLVRTTFISLSHLWETEPTTAIELISVARDASHVAFGTTGTRMVEMALAEQVNPDGTVVLNRTVRAIIVASSDGEELDMRLVSPFAKGGFSLNS